MGGGEFSKEVHGAGATLDEIFVKYRNYNAANEKGLSFGKSMHYSSTKDKASYYIYIH